VREFGRAPVFLPGFPRSAARPVFSFRPCDFCRRPHVLVCVPTGFSQRAHPSAPGSTIIFSWFQLRCSVHILVAIFWPRVLQPVSILMLWVLLDFSLESVPPLAAAWFSLCSSWFSLSFVRQVRSWFSCLDSTICAPSASVPACCL
jgi:hypothetical protein